VTIGSGVFGWLRVKVCIFPYTLKVVLTTLTLPCECDNDNVYGAVGVNAVLINVEQDQTRSVDNFGYEQNLEWINKHVLMNMN